MKTLKPIEIYYCGREVCSPGHFFGPAIRQHYLLHVVLQGKGIFNDGIRKYSLTAGEAFLIFPKEVTYYRADEQEPWEYAWIGFDGTEAGAILKQCGLSAETPVCAGKEQDLWRQAICEMVTLFQQERCNEYAMLAQFYQLFAQIYQIEENREKHDYGKGYLQAAKEYIKHNYGYPIKIEDIAKHIGIDRTYLFKLFKQEERISPQQYLIHYRIKIARDLLMQSTLSITEIAYSCGFGDTASFSRHYKAKMGKRPKDVRKWNDI